MEDKKEQLKSILGKFDHGMLTQEEKDDAIYSLLNQESAMIWEDLAKEYKKHNSVSEPGITQSHLWNDCAMWKVDFKCVDDGGLIHDENPVNKSFQLVRDDGVKAELKIIAKYSKNQKEFIDIFDRKCPTFGKDVFVAIGQLEDFFFANHEPPRPNMEIYVGEDGISYLSVCSFRCPGKPLYSIDFPRWQPYLEMMDILQSAHKEEMRKLINMLLIDSREIHQ